MIKKILALCLALFLSQGLFSKEIVVGVEFITPKEWAVMFTPLVLSDPISAKLAVEYRLHRKLNLVFPLEAKWMDYRWAIKGVGSLFSDADVPEYWYRPDAVIKPGWNFDYSQIHFSGGAGVKYFPFGESMNDAFFIKTTALIGMERLDAFGAEGIRDGLIFTHTLTLGYTWVKDFFAFGFEVGEEWTYHTNPIAKMPRLFAGFSPVLQATLGFTL
ncbi:MAG: hypothetical protein KC505_04905 [Myxococcales bacterium]|nr:hypothetical protein [Myxococcales bacterium]USN50570.1 MAG: hypothetical protein H6731_09955 [Myxococcales bacterium]